MARTQQQVDALIANAHYHLEVVLNALPAPPQRTGSYDFDAVVASCYRSPSPLARGTPVRLTLPVFVRGDPPAPGDRHVDWSALKAGQSLEIVANGNLARLRVVDGGLRLLAQAVGVPSLGAVAAHQAAPARPWWRALWS